MHAYINITFRQDLYYQFHIDIYCRLQSLCSRVIHIPQLFFCYPAGWYIQLHFNYSIVLFLSAKYLLSCKLLDMVLFRPSFRIIITNVSQDLTFIWWLYRAMYETSYFGSIFRFFYIPFSALSGSLTHIGVSSLHGGFSYHFPDEIITVGIFPSRGFIRRFYKIFINIIFYVRAFKYFHRFLR